MLPKFLLAPLVAVTILFGLAPNEAAADVSGKSYFTFVYFAEIFITDCFTFNDDDTFVSTYGLVTGEWSNESILFFFDYVEVTIDSPSEPTYKLVEAEFMGAQLIAGLMETNDGDSGYFVGFESDICEFPARIPGRKPAPDLKPQPEKRR